MKYLIKKPPLPWKILAYTSVHKVFVLALDRCWSEVLIEIYHKDFNVASWKHNELHEWLQYRAAFQSSTWNISNAVKRNSKLSRFLYWFKWDTCFIFKLHWKKLLLANMLKIYLLLYGHMRIAISDNRSLVLGASINKVRSQKCSPDVVCLLVASTYCQVLSLSNLQPYSFQQFT